MYVYFHLFLLPEPMKGKCYSWLVSLNEANQGWDGWGSLDLTVSILPFKGLLELQLQIFPRAASCRTMQVSCDNSALGLEEVYPQNFHPLQRPGLTWQEKWVSLR